MDRQEAEFMPRDYQIQLMQIASAENTIIYLPTGSGKTFIALMTLKLLSKPLARSYSQGGKISVLLVNTITLVTQHGKYFENHTNFKVGKYSGEMNLDYWPKEKWHEEFEKYNVIIMTSQILLNLVKSNFIDLNKINLLIFDECHHGVNNHAMRQVMLLFQDLKEPPRVVGLTATLLNGNCKPEKVMEEVKSLETTFHGKVATVDGLEVIVGYSTNPRELIKTFRAHKPSEIETKARALLQSVVDTVDSLKGGDDPGRLLNLKRLDEERRQDIKKLKNLIQDCVIHLDMLGIYGGFIATICYKIQIQRLRVHCVDPDFCQIYSYIITMLTYVERLFDITMKDVEAKDKILRYSSDQVKVLFSIFDEFKRVSDEELCGIVFTQRRFTSKILHHIIRKYAEENPSFQVKPDFLVGYQNNPYNSSREGLYIAKKNKQVIESFVRKEVNLLCSSNVLEEGVDIPRCTLVIKFDKPMDYRSYIQSKGRARHKKSLYYIMVSEADSGKYLKIFEGFQKIESVLNNYLIGKNKTRTAPSQAMINDMYNEEVIKSYYVNGPNSAHVGMLNAISLLCQYCQSLPGDCYTQYAPDWYIEEKIILSEKKLRVVILMPTICPLVDPIEGPWMTNKTDAKRAAALSTCIQLHKIGELDDDLLPKRQEVTEEDIQFLFPHYPAKKEPDAGTNKKRRLHRKHVPRVLKGPILPNQKAYLHLINLKPAFERKEDLNVCSLYDRYISSTTFAFLTPQPLPVICAFPTFTSLGCVDINIKVNHAEVNLTQQDLDDIKNFHFIIFDDILKVFNNYLAFDNSRNAETLLLVPFDKIKNTIDYSILRRHYTIIPSSQEMTHDDKIKLEVTLESHLHTIVTPVYRNTGTYLVTEVSLNRSPLSDFPNEQYGDFVDYYQQKHNIGIVNKKQPLLLVKGISSRLNLIKPRGVGGKRKREKNYEEVMEYLIPELVVKQDFPADLWIKASFLPTVLTRVIFLLQIEELRVKIAREADLGSISSEYWEPLEVDTFLLNYDVNLAALEKEPKEKLILDNNTPDNENLIGDLNQKIFNKDYCAKLTEAEFPWKDIDEPKDIERDLKLTVMDIEFYEKFIQVNVTDNERIQHQSPNKKSQLAITYYNANYVYRDIQFLNIQFNYQGPEQRELYMALTTAKANDIVNLERLETLGDSFLKLIASLYISVRFPNFNEGQATSLKGRMVSNKNLYYLAAKKNLGGIMRYSDLSPKEKWLPPCYTTPEVIRNKIVAKEISIESLFYINIPREEQISGNFSNATIAQINDAQGIQEEVDELESCLHSTCEFLRHQYIGDKHVSDVVESIIGLYFQKAGFIGAAKIVEWFGIIPKSENLLDLLKKAPQHPIINPKASMANVEYFLTQAKDIETNLGYKFINRAFLLQAITHPSYSINRVTRSYETLEFLGDAVLDFLITCHIFEYCGHLSPGEVTDLRSALVNNNTFASLAVRCGFHKSLLMMNAQLQGQVDKFAAYLATKNYEIDDEVTILLEEADMNLAEYVDVPKILGDIFEALIGAVYLDSGKNLQTVWKVIHRIMHREIELFRKNVPINVVRKLYETPGLYPVFSDPTSVSNQKTMVALQYLLQGRKKIVYGFGVNKAMAKKAAAKIALRSLNL